jgi:hypothetical protein
MGERAGWLADGLAGGGMHAACRTCTSRRTTPAIQTAWAVRCGSLEVIVRQHPVVLSCDAHGEGGGGGLARGEGRGAEWRRDACGMRGGSCLAGSVYTGRVVTYFCAQLRVRQLSDRPVAPANQLSSALQ